MNAEEALAAASPEAVRLAEAVCLAVHVEPALLREARLRLVPGAPPSAEADLWFSPLVEAASPQGLVIRRDVCELLARRLAREDRLRLDDAFALVRDAHAERLPTLALESEICYLTATGERGAAARIRDLWEQAVATLADPDRGPGVARWALRALEDAPAGARSSDAARVLAMGARGTLRRPLVRTGEDIGPLDRLPFFLANLPTRPVGIRLLEAGFEVSEPPARGAHVIELPDTEPLLLEAGPPGAPPERRIAIERDSVTTFGVGVVKLARAGDEPTGEWSETVWFDGGVRVLALGTRMLVVATEEGVLHTFPFDRRARRRTLALDTGVLALALSPEEDRVAVSGMDDRVRLWSPRSGRLSQLEGEPNAWSPVVFLPGRIVALSRRSGSLLSWPDGQAFPDTEDDFFTASVRFAASKSAVVALRPVSYGGEYVVLVAHAGTRRVLEPPRPARQLAVNDAGRFAMATDDVITVHWPDGEVLLHADEPDAIQVVADPAGSFHALTPGRVTELGGASRAVPPEATTLSPDGRVVAAALPLDAVELRTAAGRRYRLDAIRTEVRRWEGEVLAGRPFPLGATWDGQGTNFSLFSDAAEGVELCLFNEDGVEARVELQRTQRHWHAYVPDVGPGQRYGYRVHGPYAPEQGLRFNPAKLLLDPYAQAIDGDVAWDESLYGYVRIARDDAVVDDRDSSAAMPRSVVVDQRFDWEDDRPPNVPWSETVIYETHVKGLTKLMPGVPEPLGGTYAGLASEAAIAHLTSLGVTAVELLPVHHHVDEDFLHVHGLTNYWGYSSIGYFAPHGAYAASGTAGEQVVEFKQMVKALHRAGLEVILDVVYNHTGEGDHLGPTLSFRGIDNDAYYRLMPDGPQFYVDFTGTGNSLNVDHPSALELIMDSLRYWVLECHVDGFRFDLATTLARADGEFFRRAPFFELIAKDPLLSGVKLIAEPWDVGPGGYQLGNFPAGWSEWNGRYRDAVRDWWRGEGTRADLAVRLTGSADLFKNRGTHASINFVTAHDGFTLRDLVSYNAKHNEANREGNQDGTDDNRSWNHGVEGPTEDREVIRLRARQQRNLLATLMLSRGVPMLLGGDELGNTQHGNNNAWCQDNETSWLDWATVDDQLLEFTRRLVALRRGHAMLRAGHDRDVRWFNATGAALQAADWPDERARDLVMYVDGGTDDSLLLLFNGGPDHALFSVPRMVTHRVWTVGLSTEEPFSSSGPVAELELAGRSMAVLRAAPQAPSPASGRSSTS